MTVKLIMGEEGGWDAIVAPSITLYIDKGKDAFESYVSAYNIIIELLRPYISNYQTGSMRGAKKATDKSFELFPAMFNPKTYVETYWLNFYSGVQPNSLGEWGFYFSITPAELDWQAGYFHVFFPPAFILDKQVVFLSILRKLCETLAFCSGSAGYCVQYDFLQSNQLRDEQIHAWASRYLGVDIADLELAADVTKKKIKTVNWITLLGNQMIEELGGESSLDKLVGNGVEIEKANHGAILRAGDAPLLGDINCQEDITLYRRVNEFIRPVRSTSLLPLPGFNKNQTQDWLERFDEK